LHKPKSNYFNIRLSSNVAGKPPDFLTKVSKAIKCNEIPKEFSHPKWFIYERRSNKINI